MRPKPANYGQLWTRDQLILAFELYCRIPFQRTKANDPRVIALADFIGKTPAAVARKLGNFGAFDPQLAAKKITGLAHGSKLDREVWDEFHNDWNGLVLRAHELRAAGPLNPTDELRRPQGPSERTVTVKQRLHQSFFRDAVLSSYNTRCCITGLAISECLVAGHIVPWSVDRQRRADPTNGICLSATFDRLFDCGLITIRENLTVRVSKLLLASTDRATAETVSVREGQHIIGPVRFMPDPQCLRWHYKNIFQAAHGVKNEQCDD